MKAFQRLESIVILAALLVVYHELDFSWVWFAAFLFVPDISMIGYLFNPRVGAIVYNLGHSYFSPITLLAISWTIYHPYKLENVGMMFALIWASHIAMDRTLGFGLKLPTGFKDTHLGKIGEM